ncbi:hypothetical protein [Streptomyces sp. NPDC127084]|uniref:hypothetical protein n=1 Tax=Streptomyces sp. NPDC127084 TaxID=3347133 RepID=UPI00364C9F0C
MRLEQMNHVGDRGNAQSPTGADKFGRALGRAVLDTGLAWENWLVIAAESAERRQGREVWRWQLEASSDPVLQDPGEATVAEGDVPL